MVGSTKSDKIVDALLIAGLGLLGFLALYPLIYTLSLSLSSATEALRPGLHLYPREISFEAYRILGSNPAILDGTLNALWRTVVGTILTVLVSAMAAYPLSRQEFGPRRYVMFAIVFTMLFGGGVFPSYMLTRNLGLIDNRWVYILPGLVGAFSIIVLKIFFQAIPESLIESARIEGASEWTILFRIVLPISKPVLATVALWTALAHWNAWFDALLYINDDSKQVLQTFLRRIVIQQDPTLVQRGIVNPDPAAYTSETLKAAAIVLTVLPMLILYPFVQKHFIKGITLGAVKE